MEETVLVRSARQVLTLRGLSGPRRGSALGELGVISDGAILIRQGRILEAGLSRRLENVTAARRAREINAAGRIVMPGFVDCHAEIILPPPVRDERETAGGLARQPGLSPEAEQFWRGAQRIRISPASRLESVARDVITGMVRHGTTAVEAVSGLGLDRSGELRILRILGHLNGKSLEIVPAHSSAPFTPPQFAGDAAAYVEWLCADVMFTISRRKLARFAEVNCRENTAPADVVRHHLECLQRLGFPFQVSSGPRTSLVRMAVDLGAVSVALDRVEERDIPALARSRTIVTLMPAPAWFSGRGRYPPARRLIDAGAAVALASGFSGARDRTYNMQMVIALACREMGMSAAEAISAATINSAYAIGSGEETGSLMLGKRADLVVLNLPDYREIPHFAGVNHVHMVIKNGVTIFEEGGGNNWAAR